MCGGGVGTFIPLLLVSRQPRLQDASFLNENRHCESADIEAGEQDSSAIATDLAWSIWQRGRGAAAEARGGSGGGCRAGEGRPGAGSCRRCGRGRWRRARWGPGGGGAGRGGPAAVLRARARPADHCAPGAPPAPSCSSAAASSGASPTSEWPACRASEGQRPVQATRARPACARLPHRQMAARPHLQGVLVARFPVPSPGTEGALSSVDLAVCSACIRSACRFVS